MRLDLRAIALAITLFMLELYYGLGYLVGPPQLMTSGTFTYAKQVLPQHVWGVGIVFAAVMTAVAPRLPWWGSIGAHSLAAVPLSLFAALLAMAEGHTMLHELGLWPTPGPAQGWGGAATFFIPVLVHFVLGRERYRRREAEQRLARMKAVKRAD